MGSHSGKADLEQEGVTQRECGRCGIKYLLTKRNFIGSKNCRFGLTRICRPCANIYSRDWKNKDKSGKALRRNRLYAQKNAKRQAERRERVERLTPLRTRARIMINGLKERIKARSLPFEKALLSIPFMVTLLEKTPRCPCCNKPFDCGRKFNRMKNDRSPTLDQITPGTGYKMENVAIICWRCNNLKRDATAEELQLVVNWMKAVNPISSTVAIDRDVIDDIDFSPPPSHS